VVNKLSAVSFEQITRVLELTDQLEISREWVEIPLSSANPGTVKKLPNGKLEIVVDSEVPFDEWLKSLEDKIKAVLKS
jgi:hypothetical protein